MQEKVELAEALDTTGVIWREWKGENGRRELLEERPGDERVFISGRGAGWQMKPGQTPYRTWRAVNEITGLLNRMA
jgi:hypothetical protein